jgi:riboflavin synthase
MFTGIIEALGTVEKIRQEATNKSFLVASSISDQLKIDQSVSHSGVCLTVVEREPGKHWVTAIKETLHASNLDAIKTGSRVNLERCMLNNGRFDGHIVQGHVDQTGKVNSIKDENGSWIFQFEYATDKKNVTVEKGSISVNGVSLTCFDSRPGSFSVAIIPYTFENTTFGDLRVGDTVNLEFDVIGKYVARLLAIA